MFDKFSPWRSLLLALFVFGALTITPVTADHEPSAPIIWVPRCLPHDAMVKTLNEKFGEKIKNKKDVNGIMQEFLVGPKTWTVIAGVEGPDSKFCIIASGKVRRPSKGPDSREARLNVQG